MKKIIVLTAVFAMLFTSAAVAADWNFYGSSRMWLFSKSLSKEKSPITGGGAPESFTTTIFDQQPNSRIGATVAGGDVSGRFEWGHAKDVTDGGGTARDVLRLRQLYGSWNFGGGKMTVGQKYPPTYWGLSNQVAAEDNGLAGVGAPAGRFAMIEFEFGGFKIAAVEPATGYDGVVAGTNSVQVTLPKLEAAWNGAVGPVKLHVSGGYNAANVKDNTTKKDFGATSYILGLMGKYNAGPLMVGGYFSYGVNGKEYADGRFGQDAKGNYDAAKNQYKDNTAWGAGIVVGFTINDMMGIEGGYGYMTAEDEGAKDADVGSTYYVQLPITLADGVFVVPEFSMFDDMDSGAAKGAKTTPQGNTTYIGAKFQINF
jgi:hypothetical protein